MVKIHDKVLKHKLFADHLDESITFNYQRDGISHVLDSYDCSVIKEVRQEVDRQLRLEMNSNYFDWGKSRQRLAALKSAHERSFRDVKEGRACGTCAFSAYHAPGRTPAYKHLEGLLKMEASAKTLARVNSSTTASAVQRRRDQVKDYLSTLEGYMESHRPAEEEKYLLSLKSSLEETLKKLSSSSQSPDLLRKLERRVQNHLVPKAFRDQDFELDASMKLVGISPAPAFLSGDVGYTVKAVIEAYAIRKDKEAVVLYAPAYFYSFLLASLCFRKSSANFTTLVVSASAPDTPEARETTAFLWNPQQRTELACLSKATSAGEALSE